MSLEILHNLLEIVSIDGSYFLLAGPSGKSHSCLESDLFSKIEIRRGFIREFGRCYKALDNLKDVLLVCIKYTDA